MGVRIASPVVFATDSLDELLPLVELALSAPQIKILDQDHDAFTLTVEFDLSVEE